MRDVLHWLPVQQRIHYRISSIVWHCVLGNAPSYLLELFNLTSACSGRGLSARPPRGTFWCHVLALPPDRKWLSRLWVSLFGMIFPLNFVLCRVTFPVLFIYTPQDSPLWPSLGWERL